jgi:Ala-tRNA(Pro) deacylase
MRPPTVPEIDPAPQVYSTLDRMGIAYVVHAHPPVFTSEEADRHWSGIDGVKVKNLFLRNKKGDRHYLVILDVAKRADLQQLVKVIGDDRLSFGSPERLKAALGVTPGSVSPFGLIHDGARAVRVIVDEDLRAADRLIFHPNINTASVVIAGADFVRFLASTGHEVRWVRVG